MNCAAQLADIEIAERRLISAQSRVEAKRDALRQSKVRIQTAKNTLAHSQSEAAIFRQAKDLLVALADSRREIVRDRIERLVTAALRAVFPDRSPSFRLDVSIKRGSVSMVPQIGYPAPSGTAWVSLDSVGGGVIDVVSFTLRVAVLTMMPPDYPRVIIADEPFKHVSRTRIQAVSELVSKLAARCKIQFLIVSHESELADAADRVFQVSRMGGQKTGYSVVDCHSAPTIAEGDIE